jgi:spoIIIJ-associated protein
VVEGEDDYGLLIGRRGQTIDAVQLVCYRAAFRGLQDRKRVVVDAAGYRERRRETIERQAERAAERALSSGKEIELEPMTPMERKIVHDALKDRSGLETFSEGDEPERCVIVAPLVNAGDD